MNEPGFDRDEFFQDLVDQEVEIVSDLNPEGIIRIPVVAITNLGYHDKRSFDEEFLHEVHAEVERITGIDFEIIIEKMKDRTVYILVV